jgi:hypothetical protein
MKKHSWRIGHFTIPNYARMRTVDYTAWNIPVQSKVVGG